MSSSFKSHDKILFIGDSITDSSRKRPIGRSKQVNTPYDQHSGLGSGYVSGIENLLVSTEPQLKLEIINQGCNGNRITDLQSRWQKDVIEQKTDWLVILIGINDVWRHFDRPQDPNQVSIEQFEEIYTELLVNSQIEAQKKILMTPYYLEVKLSCKMRTKMEDYGKVVRKLAKNYQCNLVDLQSAFDNC